MSINKYVNTQAMTAESLIMGDTHDYGATSKALLSALGDYWSDYFSDLDNLVSAATGAEVLVSESYNKLLDFVLSSSLLQIPVKKPVTYNLIVFNEEDFCPVIDEAGDVECYTVKSPGIRSLEYLVSTLFEPNIVLEDGVHYEVDYSKEVINFYVDLFNDKDIFEQSYTYNSQNSKKILLWATNLALVESNIYERFGRYLYTNNVDSEDYRWLVTALMYFYVNAKSAARIETVVNVLFGLPFSRTPGEVVSEILYVDKNDSPVAHAGFADYYKIVTNFNSYYAPIFTDLLVTVGQALANYQLLAKLNVVEDYITNPDWYDNSRFPYELLTDYRHPEFIEWCENNDEFSEYSKYLNEEYDSSISFNNTRYYVGLEPVVNTYEGKSPFSEVICSSTSTGFQKNLYDILDNVLKYNILHFYLELNFDNYDFYTKIKDDLYSIVRPGLPVYLYPFIETIFKSEFYDGFLIETNKIFNDAILTGFNDRLCSCLGRLYDSNHKYNEFSYSAYFNSVPEYNGSDYYDSSLEFEFYYSCKSDSCEHRVSNAYDDNYEFSEVYLGGLVYSGEVVFSGSEKYDYKLIKVDNDYEHNLSNTFQHFDEVKHITDGCPQIDLISSDIDNFISGTSYNASINYKSIHTDFLSYDRVNYKTNHYNDELHYRGFEDYRPRAVLLDAYDSSNTYAIDTSISNYYTSYKHQDNMYAIGRRKNGDYFYI